MSMEDILQDPKSTWEEMRSVMRSQGHATNGGIVMALVTALEATLSRDISQEEHAAAPRAVDTAKEPEDDNEDSIHHSQLDDVLSNLEHPVKCGYKPCNTRVAATNNPRRDRAALHSSYNSATNYSVNSSISSVDMMDFGVDNDASPYSMETLNEFDSRRQSSCSITHDEGSNNCPANAFLDWNHGDESSASAHAGQDVHRGESCPANDTHNSEQHSPEPEMGRRESWHIEDHDFEPQTNHHRVFPKMLHRLSSGTYDTVSSIFSRLSQELDTSTLFHHDVRCDSQAQEATTDEVKRALSFRIAKYRVDMNNRRASC